MRDQVLPASWRGLPVWILAITSSFVGTAAFGKGENIVVTKSNTIVATAGGDAYVSVDQGASFYRSGAGLDPYSLGQMLQLYAPSDGQLFGCATTNLYRSVSATQGLRWTVAARGPVGPGACRLGWSDDATQFVAYIGGDWFASKDGGLTFAKSARSEMPVQDIGIIRLPAKGRTPAKNVWFALTVKDTLLSVMRSDDAGKTFSVSRTVDFRRDSAWEWDFYHHFKRDDCRDRANDRFRILTHDRSIVVGPFLERCGSRLYLLESPDAGKTWREVDLKSPARPWKEARLDDSIFGPAELMLLIDEELWRIDRTRLKVLGTNPLPRNSTTGNALPRTASTATWFNVGPRTNPPPRFMISQDGSYDALTDGEPLEVLLGGAKYVAEGSKLTRQAAEGEAVDVSHGLVDRGPETDITALAASENGTLYVGLGNGDLCTTSDDGFKWSCVAGPSRPLRAVSRVAGTQGSRLIVATPTGPAVSDDEGKSWQRMLGQDGSPLDIAITAFKKLAVGGKPVVLAASLSGLFAWEGGSWYKAWPNTGAAVVSGYFDGEGQSLYALTTGSGALQIDASALPIKVKAEYKTGLLTPDGENPAPLVSCAVRSIDSQWASPVSEGDDHSIRRRSAVICTGKRFSIYGAKKPEDRSHYEFVPPDHRFRRIDEDIHQEGTNNARGIWPLFELERGRLVVLAQGLLDSDKGVVLGNKIYVSQDNGIEWKTVPFPFTDSLEEVPIQIGPREFLQSTRYMNRGSGTQLVRFSMDDQGRAAVKPLVADKEADPDICAVSKHDEKSLYCRAGGEVLRSGDGGISFKRMQKVEGAGIAVSPVDAKTVYAGREVSSDGGFSWKTGAPWVTDSPEKARVIGVLSDGRPLIFYRGVFSRRAQWVLGAANRDLSEQTTLVTLPAYVESTEQRFSCLRLSEDGTQFWLVATNGLFACDMKKTGSVGPVPAVDKPQALGSSCVRLPDPPGNSPSVGCVMPSRSVPGAMYYGGVGTGVVYLPPGVKQWKRMEGY